MLRTFRRAVAAAVSALMVTGALVGVAGSTTADAADLGQFNPGMIISDSVFYDTSTMSAAQIQSFLDTKGANCVAATGNTCLKNFRQTTASRAADDRCTGAYTGASNETAAQIVAKVAAACGINPQVLLVTLQKEQGLVTATAGKSAAVYQKAMGYGCPDTAPCDTLYYGFANQLYNAAHQFKNYAAKPTSYAHRAGMVNQVRFHPDATCGSSAVYIQNQATASLYNYTPYQPNSAALAAGYGTGNSCSSYGNRNFWNYFTDWFGSTQQREPIGSLDELTQVGPGAVRVRGWTLDPDTTSPIQAHIYVDGTFAASIVANTARADVGAIYGKGDNHGFDTTIKLSNGTHTVCVSAIDSAGGSNPRIGCGTVTTTNQAPIGSVDQISASGVGALRVRGWTLDPDTTASIQVHIYVNGTFVRAAQADGQRADVAAAYGKGSAHGFDVTLAAAAGSQRVCVYALDSTGGTNPELGCTTVTVNNQRPIGRLDSLTVTGISRVQVKGWTFDPDTRNPITAHLYVDGVFRTAVTANASRPDVDAVYGTGANHGVDTTLTLTDGVHEVCLYAIDSSGGWNPKIACKSVTVVNQRPIGKIDSLTPGLRGQVQVRGWTLDPDTRDPITAHLYVDGVFHTAVTANASRPDVDAVHGKGANHGIDTTITLTQGTHQVCLYAIDSSGGWNPKLNCVTVTATAANSAPIGRIDSAVSGMGSISVAGWALDPDTTDPISAQVSVDGRVVTTVTANGSRPDVDAVYHQGVNHGYTATVSATAGEHQVCVTALDSSGGPSTQVACRTVQVNGLAFGSLDEVSVTSSGIRARGWAIDPNTTAPIVVHLYVDGVATSVLTANGTRADVQAAYQMGAAHGFDTTVVAARGSHRVCAYAIDTWGGTNPEIGCAVVTVP
ncbi:hypothetical protein [Cellulomonas sp. RIT-PI-Y]|uniref:hypothetical protein n=1 Tax=Cellulomonas sp. RIT-PI-Y TaxID=3035297 RepID=UPI0021D85CC0|nr:hypothetical protein [Cellulomonas sp. RIT-PI-Y]